MEKIKLIFIIIFPATIFAQFSDNTLSSLKTINYREYLSLELSILSCKLSSGTYQTENGKFEYPINIYLDEDKYISFDIYMNCFEEDLNDNKEIVKDQIIIVFSAIKYLLTKIYGDLDLDKFIKGRLYNNPAPNPIGYWNGEKYYDNN